jgi:hypothetical protein
LQRYDSANFGLILEKNTFSHRWQLYTVTQDDYELRKAAHVFDWWWGVEVGPAYVGCQGLKDPVTLPVFLSEPSAAGSYNWLPAPLGCIPADAGNTKQWRTTAIESSFFFMIIYHHHILFG